jgi:isochorismate hydrolase
MLAQCHSTGHRGRCDSTGRSALLVLDVQDSSRSRLACLCPFRFGHHLAPFSYHKHILTDCQHFHPPCNTSQDAGQMAIWWPVDLRKSGSAIVRISTRRGQMIEKSQYDAFFQSSLADSLSPPVKQVVIGG